MQPAAHLTGCYGRSYGLRQQPFSFISLSRAERDNKVENRGWLRFFEYMSSFIHEGGYLSSAVCLQIHECADGWCREEWWVTHWCCWAQANFCAGRYWIWPGCGCHSVLKMDETELIFLFMKHSNELALWDWIRQVSKCNFRRLRFSVYAAIYFVLNNSSTWVAFCFQVGFKKLLWVNYLGSVFQVIQCYFVCFNCAIQSSCPQASVVKVQSVFHKTGQAVAEGHTSSLLCFKMAKASSSSVKLTLREINKFC